MKNKQSTEMQVFSTFLKNKGLSSTKQRRIILDHVFRNHDHFEADEIVEGLRRKKVRVSRATVYRTLFHLEECKLIRKVDLGHGHQHYEHTWGHIHHEHLYCKQCGKIVEFTDQTLEERIKNIAVSHRFFITSHTVQLFGICSTCQKGTIKL